MLLMILRQKSGGVSYAFGNVIQSQSGKQTAIAPVKLTSGPAGLSSFELAHHIDAVGSVTFTGRSGDSAAGWQIGFLQAEWVETNWGLYRGIISSDGSSLIQRGKPPARPHQACLDNTNAGDPFYGEPTDDQYTPAGETQPLANVVSLPLKPTFPLTVKAYHYDKPSDSYDLTRVNTRNGKINNLEEVQLEFMFCAMLVVRSPAGQYHYLNHFYWNTRWQDKFQLINGTMTALPVVGGSDCGLSPIFSGKPNDRRFRSVLAHPQRVNCTDVFRQAARVHNFREELQWNDFDVRR